MSIKKRDETISVRRRQRSSLRRQPRLSAGDMTDGAYRYEEHDKKPRDHGLSLLASSASGTHTTRTWRWKGSNEPARRLPSGSFCPKWPERGARSRAASRLESISGQNVH